jgi:hypothetical protein
LCVWYWGLTSGPWEYSTTWVISSVLFCFKFVWQGFSLTLFWLAPNYLHLPSSWDHRHAPPWPASSFRRGIANFCID